MISTLHVKCPPFWNLLGITDTKQQVGETAQWLMGMETNGNE